MDLTASTTLDAAPARVFAEVADLATYPHWLGIVHSAIPEPGEQPAWSVELGARLGPFRRTKRVRMERVVCDEPTAVRFERVEGDGREHSAWVLRAELRTATEAGTELTMHLHYGGAAWLPGLDLVLGQEVRRAGARLQSRLA